MGSVEDSSIRITDLEVLGETPDAKLYLFEENSNKRVLKVLKTEYPDPGQIFQFTNEFHNTKELEIHGVRRAIRHEKIDGRYTLVLEYVEGLALSALIARGRIQLLQTIKIIRNLASTLSNLHHIGLIHRDLNTNNVIFDPASSATYVIDFGNSSYMGLKTTLQGNPNLIQGALPYISPEQTGRMNRKVDARSDLYSLGIIFYEMVVGQRPFTSIDPLELIHSHIAVQPATPVDMDEQVPKPISDIIMALLSKNAENRYQSAFGLTADLESCIDQLENNTSIRLSELSLGDLTGQFTIPEKLYGRDEELNSLVDSFDRLSHPWVETIMVSGFSGVGKSALVNEIIRSSSEGKGYFVKGKFDQYQKSMPYFGFIEPFEELCNYLLTERKDRFEAYKNNILEALDGFGQIIVDLIPSLELIIGEQPEVQKLEPLENINRFNRIFLKFIGALTSEKHPLVMFIDDLQWADSASLDLLYTLMAESELSNLLLIGAYRDNEVVAKHPLTQTLERAEAESNHIAKNKLDALSLENVVQLVSDTLSMTDIQVTELAEFIYSKSRGNAFYTKELFKSLYDEKLITFNANQSAWIFDMESINQKGFSDNVIDFMTGLLARLPDPTLEVLKYAACVGNLFDTQLLSTLLKIDQSQIYNRLKRAIKEELIVPLARTFEHASIIDQTEDKGGYEYVFSHDRIQQAIYSLIEENDQRRIHLQIGRQLKQRSDDRDTTVFDIASQLNKAIDLLTDDQERSDLAQINIEAAAKSKDSTAYQVAVGYLEAAERLLHEDAWVSQYEMKYKAQKMMGELLYLVGNFDRSEAIIQECLKRSKSNIEKADLYYILILRKTHSSLYTEAINDTRKGLALFDFLFPEKTNPQLPKLIQEHFDYLNKYFSQSEVIELANKDDLKGGQLLAVIKLLDNLSMATYVGGEHELWTLQALMKVKFAIVHGISPETAYAFAELGLIYSLYQNYELGYECGKLSKKLADRFASRSLGHKGRSFHLIANYIYPWHHHIREIKDINLEGFNDCMNSGEMIFAGYINFHEPYCDFYTGLKHLDDLGKEIKLGIQFNKKIKHDLAWDALIVLDMCNQNLLGNTESALEVSNNNFNEQEFIAFCQAKNEFYGIACFYNYKAMLLYLYGAHEEADACYDKLTDFLPPLIGSVLHYSSYIFYFTLNKLALYDAMDADDKASMMEIIDKNIGILSMWSKPGPDNMLHKLYLVQAEKARVLGDHFEAQELYHASIQAAQEGKFIHNEALAYERAGLFWVARDNMFYAKPNLEAANHGYSIWGAKRKSKELKSAFPNIFSDTSGSQLASITTSAGGNFKNLNISNLLEVSRSLSGEMEMVALLQKLMQVLVQSAGADKVILITKDHDEFYVVSRYSIGSEDPTIENELVDKIKDIAHAMVQYVARTQKEYFASDADTDKLISHDPYILKHKPKSAAMLPLILKNELKGMVYLENSVASGALFNDRLEFIRMLLFQISVSLENAKLYTDMKSLNQAYEKYVPSGFLNVLGRDSIEDLKLGDQVQKNMTVLFSDIRAYTTMSEKMTPEDNFLFINEYLSTVAPSIRNNGGFINQIIGDGIMALFDDAENAMEASLGILDGVDRFNRDFGGRNNQTIKVGLGLHSGLMMLGIIGYEERFSTGVISNAVNTASRMEGLTKIFGSSVVISENTLSQIEHLERYNYRLLGLIQVKGRNQAIKVYEFFDGDPDDIVALKSEYAELYDEGLNHYFNKNFIGCASCFRQILDRHPGDVAAKRYLERAAHLLVSGVDEHWTGVETMTSK